MISLWIEDFIWSEKMVLKSIDTSWKVRELFIQLDVNDETVDFEYIDVNEVYES